MNLAIFALLIFVSMAAFTVLNQRATQMKTWQEGLRFAVLTMPIQAVLSLLIMMAYNIGSDQKWWMLTLYATACCYATNLIVSATVFHNLPTRGQVIGLILTLIGALVGKFA